MKYSMVIVTFAKNITLVKMLWDTSRISIRHYKQKIVSNQKSGIRVHYSWQNNLHYPLIDVSLERCDEKNAG